MSDLRTTNMRLTVPKTNDPHIGNSHPTSRFKTSPQHQRPKRALFTAYDPAVSVSAHSPKVAGSVVSCFRTESALRAEEWDTCCILAKGGSSPQAHRIEECLLGRSPHAHLYHSLALRLRCVSDMIDQDPQLALGREPHSWFYCRNRFRLRYTRCSRRIFDPQVISMMRRRLPMTR